MDAGGERDASNRVGFARRIECASPALVRLAILYRHVGCPQASRGQYAYTDRHRHQCRIPLLIVAVAWPSLFPKMSLAEVFWDVTDVVIALVTLGLALELKAKGRTSEAIKKLIGLQPK